MQLSLRLTDLSLNATRAVARTAGLTVAALSLSALLGLDSASASAQGGGFTAGDMYLYSASLDAPSGPAGPSVSGLVHVNLALGTADYIVPTGSQFPSSGSVVFDPYRQRIIFDGTIGDPPATPVRLWAMDAAGQLEDLFGAYTTNAGLSCFAPTGDGRIYFRATSTNEPLRYLDASNTVQVVLDDTGTVPFLLDGSVNFDYRGMIYDAGTNSLIIAPIVSNFCPGGVNSRINVRKLPLSADGTRVVGPITCAQFEVSSSAESMAGFSYGPAGQIMLVVDTNTNNEEPRMLLVDPVTLAISPFGSNGPYGGAAAGNAGTWCSALGQVVILDTGTNVLRAFGAGSGGPGTILTLTGSVSSTGGSAEQVSLAEVLPSACSGGWMAYGEGLAGAGAFVPRLVGGGCPEVGGTFSLSIDRAVGGSTALLFVGLASAAVPFKGGTFHVGAVVLTTAVPMGGSVGVPGDGALLLPASLPSDPLLEGVEVFMQTAFADPAAIVGVSLSKGLRMTIGG
ncbi:MAG: hypothetical protein ACT4PU_01140 [Planctomycetota bacterium]